MEKDEVIENGTEGTEENLDKGNAQALDSSDTGESASFEQIINHPDYQKEYRKAIDREISKAIKSYQKNHETDIEKLVNEKVSAQVRDVKFNASLKEKLRDAGVIDNVAFMAHLDLDKLKESYEEGTESFKGFDELIANSKQKMPYLFKQEEQKAVSTGKALTGFGNNKKAPTTLSEALHAKYKI